MESLVNSQAARLHQEAERRWTKLEREHPELRDTIAVGRGLVTRYIDELPAAARIALTPERAREKLAAGLPLLAEEELDLDLPGIRRFFASLCLWAGEQHELADDANRLREALSRDTLTADDLLAAALSDDQEALAAIAARLSVAPLLPQTLAGFTASAALMETARELTKLLAGSSIEWLHASCPICGGRPLLSELQGSAGQRVLRCATCGGGWNFPRTRCAHCGTLDTKHLHYLAAEGQEEKYRVDLCDNCHGFLKSTTAFAPTPTELLTIEDAALLHLEEAARERGYTATPAVGDQAHGPEAARC